MIVRRKMPRVDWDAETKRMAKYLGTLADDARAKGDNELVDFLGPFSRKIGSCGVSPDGKRILTCGHPLICYRCAAIAARRWARETDARLWCAKFAYPDAELYEVSLSLKSASERQLGTVINELLHKGVDYLRNESIGAAWTLHVTREGSKYFPHVHALVLVLDPGANWCDQFCSSWKDLSGATSKRQHAAKFRTKRPRRNGKLEDTGFSGALAFLNYLGHGPRDRNKRPLHPEHIYSIWLALCEASNSRNLSRMCRTRGRTGCLYGRTLCTRG